MNGPDTRSLGTALRAVALLVLLTGMLSGISYLVPARAGVTELARDAGPDGSTTVQVWQSDLLEARARWSTGFLGDKEITYRFEELPPSPGAAAALRDTLERRLRADGKTVRFTAGDPLAKLGGLSLLLPVLYWRFLPDPWLRAAALLCGTGVLGAVALRRRSRAAPAYWLLACLLGGTGFLVHLWAEPRPLWRRGGDDPLPGPPPLAGSTVLLATAALLVLAVLAGVTLGALRG